MIMVVAKFGVVVCALFLTVVYRNGFFCSSL